MSTRGVVVRVEAGAALCPLCAGPTVVQKSTRRNVVTLEEGVVDADAQATFQLGVRSTSRRIADQVLDCVLQ